MPTKLMVSRSSRLSPTPAPACTLQGGSAPSADQATSLLKAQVAGSIVATLQDRCLTARAGAAAAGIDPADVQRIRNTDLARFTLDRLVRVAHRLGHRIKIVVQPPGGGA